MILITRTRSASSPVLTRRRGASKAAFPRGAWERGVALLLLVFVLLPSQAPGEEPPLAPVENAPAKFPGRIFLASFRNVVSLQRRDVAHRGVVALDPNDGTWRKVLDKEPEKYRSSCVRISPDGRRLALNRLNADDVDPGLWISMTTGEPEAYRASERRGAICWSHDGKSVFVSTRNRGGFEAWRVHLDGTPEERLPFKLTDYVYDQSSDGTLLLTDTSSTGQREITLIRPDGTDRREMASVSRPTFDFYGHLDAPRFSSDGHLLLAGYTHNVKIRAMESQQISIHTTKSGLWEMDLRSGQTRRSQERDLSDGALLNPSWSPDGEAIAGRSSSAPDGPGTPLKTSLVIVARSGAVLKTMPWPEDLRNFFIFEWR